MANTTLTGISYSSGLSGDDRGMLSYAYTYFSFFYNYIYKYLYRGGKLYQRTKDKMLGELRELAKNKAEWGVFVSNMYQFLLKE